jgi:hypothetical protein
MEIGELECPHSMSEHLSPRPFSDDEPKPSASMPKTADYLYAFRGTFDWEPHGVCWVRADLAITWLTLVGKWGGRSHLIRAACSKISPLDGAAPKG